MMIHNRCKYVDKQTVKLQESPGMRLVLRGLQTCSYSKIESIPDGQTPQTVNVVAYESLYDSVRPGDRFVPNLISNSVLTVLFD